jgi:hypothetical protein
MTFGITKILPGILFLSLTTCVLGHALCPVDVVVVKGRVVQAPSNSTVRVQLVYPGKLGGDSGEAASVEASFRIPVEFITQSRRPLLVGTLGEKCDRRPETVIVTLVAGDPSQEYDSLSLDLAGDFVKTDSNTYALKSEIVLKASR